MDFSEYCPEVNSFTLDQNAAPTIEEEALTDGVSIALLRNKLGIDRYSSEESLNSSVLDYKVYGTAMNLILFGGHAVSNRFEGSSKTF